jgi:hypothetical protein
MKQAGRVALKIICFWHYISFQTAFLNSRISSSADAGYKQRQGLLLWFPGAQ